jgi:hypothetical protein
VNQTIIDKVIMELILVSCGGVRSKMLTGSNFVHWYCKNVLRTAVAVESAPGMLKEVNIW